MSLSGIIKYLSGNRFRIKKALGDLPYPRFRFLQAPLNREVRPRDSSIPFRRKTEIREPAAGAAHGGNLLHLVVRQREVEDGRCWRTAAPPWRCAGITTTSCCTRKRRHTCAADLPCALPISLQHRIAGGLAARDRAVGDDARSPWERHASITLVWSRRRVHLDLVAHQRLARRGDRLLDHRDGEIGHADVARQPVALEPCTARPASRRAGCAGSASAAAGDRRRRGAGAPDIPWPSARGRAGRNGWARSWW